MAFEITGKVIDVSPVQQVSDKFRKREFVIESSEQGNDGREFYEYIKFQCIQDRCELINEEFLNETVRVSFNIKGRRWERDGNVSYFTNLDAWRVERESQGAGIDDNQPPPPPMDDIAPENEEFGDLPF